MPRKARRGPYGTFITNRSQRLQKIGSCVVLVGVLMSIMGIIFTIVAYGNTDEKGRVPGFYIAGPFLIAISCLCLIIGFALFRMTEPNLYWCYNRCPRHTSKKELCICILCFVCYIAGQTKSRGDNSRALNSTPTSTDPPKSILSACGPTRAAEHKHIHNHVRFDGHPGDEEMTGSERSTSSTSLQRHCRVHPMNGSDFSLNSVHTHQLPDTFVSDNNRHNGQIVRAAAGNLDRPASASDVTTVFILRTDELQSTSFH